MLFKSFFANILPLTLLLLLSSCTGGGGDFADSSGGIGGTGVVSIGTISALGSITVNGVKYETETAEIYADGGELGDESMFRIGQLVRVDGTLNSDGVSGIASLVDIQDNLEGPINAVTESQPGLEKVIVVLNQTVVIGAETTVFDNHDTSFSFATLGPDNLGNVVEVNGYLLPDGRLEATFIMRKANDIELFLENGEDLEVEGLISNLTAEGFELAGLLVDITSAVLNGLENAPTGALENGLWVEVEADSFNMSTDTLAATEVTVQAQGVAVSDLDEAELEGFIHELNTANNLFIVNGQQVDYSLALFENGSEADIANGVKVEVEGSIVNSLLIADQIEIEDMSHRDDDNEFDDSRESDD